MSDQPQVNGTVDGGKYIDSIDPDDPEYQKDLRRPAEVKEDLKQMEQRQRVSLIMQSQAFREELEQLVSDSLSRGNHPANLLALQQLADYFLPTYKFNQAGHNKGGGTIIPIADIRGVDSLNYSKGEKIIRCKLASAYRLVDMYGWSHGINNHITARIGQDHEHFLISPFGLLYHEVTASSLVKVDMQGEILDPGSTTLSINKSGYTLHSAIHQARPDIKCIIHLHTPSAVAVSVMKCGLLPISQESLICGEVSYYDYTGVINDRSQKDSLARTLGPSNKVMFLRNHGVVACGETIEEAFHFARNVMSACDTQMRVIPAGIDNLVQVPEDIRRQTFETASQSGESGGRKWRTGEMEFEAYMRFLDACGYRSGHIFHEPILRRDHKKERANSEVEIPPAASSFTYVYDEAGNKYQSPIKQVLEKQKKQVRSEWLNTPNAYRKEEIEETGTQNPKKITKWVSEGTDTQTGQPMRIEKPNQFAPQGQNPKEFRLKHQEIRKEYYEDRIDAGPQSKILEGMSWEDAEKIKEGHISGTTDSVIVVGAASKGIIQRDHQHNAVVYKTAYTPNPFDNMSAEEIEAYKKEVEQKSTGGEGEGEAEAVEITPGPDGRLISTDERMEQVRQAQAPPQEEPAPPAASSQRYKETSVDDLFVASQPPPQHSTPYTGHTVQARPAVKETSIDDVMDVPELQQAPPPARRVPPQPLPRAAVESPQHRGTPPHHGVPVLPPAAAAQYQYQVQQRPPVSPRHSVPTSPHSPSSPTTPPGQDLYRSSSARYPPQRAPVVQPANLERSRSDRKPRGGRASQPAPVNGGEPAGSPTKSTSSGEGTLEEGSPSKDTKQDKKKKKKFRMPSFSTKKNKKEKPTAAEQ